MVGAPIPHPYYAIPLVPCSSLFTTMVETQRHERKKNKESKKRKELKLYLITTEQLEIDQ